jgi:hypothetical protein
MGLPRHFGQTPQDVFVHLTEATLLHTVVPRPLVLPFEFLWSKTIFSELEPLYQTECGVVRAYALE